jgi:transcriptional regulator with XRE-family HTH domain
LRQERDRKKKSAEELARASGVSIEAIRKLDRFETAHPGFFTIADLARALDLDLAAIDRRLRSGR